jgi:hypothetical protein
MNDLSDREQQIIAEWTRDCVNAAVYAGFVQLPWRPTERIVGALHSYYAAGMTPAEGAEALFARRH